jgi:Flp pilus assembly protein TadG
MANVRRIPGKKRVNGWRRGTAVVELAVVSPLLFAMLFGIIEFGWLFTVQHSLVNASREGARVGCLSGAEVEDIRQTTKDFLTPMGLQDKVTIVITESTVDDPFVTVKITVPREDVSLVGNFFGFSGGQLEGTTTMRQE